MTPLTLTPSASLSRPQAVLFDWDNTLIDSWPVIHQTLNATLTAFGLEPWTFDETRNRVRKSMRDSFPGLFGERWLEAADYFYARFAEIHLEFLTPLPGAEQMLRDLKESGFYLGVVSNKKGDYLRREMAHLGWDAFFGRGIGALDAKADKPARETVDMALDGSGITRGPNVWFAGDADIDLECAVNAGCLPVLVREKPPEPGEFEDFPPVIHVENCIALSKLLRSL